MYKKKKSISDYKPNESFSDIFVVRFTKGIRETKNGKFFFEAKIQDANGDAMLKYWGSSDRKKVENVYEQLKEDSVIFAEGTVSEYNEKIDFSVNDDKLKVLKEEEYDISELLKKSEKDPEEMFRELKSISEGVENKNLKKLLDSFLCDEVFVKDFKKAPAAIYIHHGWVSGLLEHTLTVTKICCDIQKNYPETDKDFVIAGAILHDVGKIDDFILTTQIKTTVSGNLLGHIVNGAEKVMKKCEELGISEDVKNKLVHIIISHHGKLEYGSPKEPMTPEAIIVSRADVLDAVLTGVIDLKKNSETNDSFIYSKHFGSIFLE